MTLTYMFCKVIAAINLVNFISLCICQKNIYSLVVKTFPLFLSNHVIILSTVETLHTFNPL